MSRYRIGRFCLVILFILPLGLARQATGDCTVILSEYVEGTSNNKAVELYNPGPDAINLSSAGSNYVVQVYANGSTSPTTISLTGTVAAGATYVLVHSLATSTLLAVANQTNSSLAHNGNDALVLRVGGASGAVVDSFGQVGFNPGTAWSSNGVTTVDSTLRRKATVTIGDTNSTDSFDPSVEWDSYAVNTFTGLGSHTNDCNGSPPEGTPPTLNSIGNRSVEIAVPLQFTISATPTDGDTVTLSVSNAPAGAVLASTNENGTFTWGLPSPAGVYTTTFYAVDKDGFDSETITITVTPQSSGVTSNLWDFEDGWQNWTNYSRFSNKDWSRIMTNGAESTAWKTEISGFQGDTSSDDWLISPGLDLSAVTDPFFSYWTYRVNSGNDIQVKISTNYPGTGDPLAAGVVWDTLTLNRPANQSVWAATTNNLSAYVGQGSVYIAFYYTSTRTRAARWSVDQIRYWATAVGESNQPPVLGPIGDKSLIVSNNLFFPVTAIDPVDHDAITLTVSNAPAGSEFSATNGSGSFIWVNASPVGVYTTSFYAVDKDGADFETILITISGPPGPTNLPVLAAIGNKSVTISNSLQFAVSASDADGDAISLIASNLPAGATFSATNANGGFLWANAAPVGTYTTRFYAVDNDGADSEAVTLIVNAMASTGTIVFQGFDGAVKDTWGYSGSGTNLASAARTDMYGRQLTTTESMTLSNVSLAGHSSIMLTIHCASTGGIENLDSLEVYVALDGAAFSSTPDVTIQEGNPTDAVYNLTWPYSASGVASTEAGTPATFNGDGETGYSTVRIHIPDTASSASVKITSANSSVGENYWIDDIELSSGTLVFHDPPTLAPVGNQAGNVGTSLLLNLSATDPDEDPITMIASNLPAGAVFMDMGSGVGKFIWANPAVVGVYTTSFSAVTSDGSDSEQIVITITEASSTTEATLKLMAANLSSGTSQAYEDPGIRIFQGLKPDVACLQEFNFSGGIRALVDEAFGTNYSYYVETDGEQIPNGVVSRYPILSSGQWVDPNVANRDFAWAIIDIPGTQNLCVVSVHFLTTGTSERNAQATLLRGLIQTNFAGQALIAVCGDLNTANRTESCISTLSTVVTDTIQPRDQNGDMDTNSGRDSDYDYVLTSTTLNGKHTNTVIGGVTFSYGMVFDSRIWASPPDPVLSSDSGASGMQHMGVMKTFTIAQASIPSTQATIYVLSGSNGSISPATNSLVNFHQNKAFTITAATNYAISNVQVDGVSIGATNAYTFSNVTNNHSIVATFNMQFATNGVPCWWLASYGWTSDFDNAAIGDQDGDGALTWQEYVAGTIPTNKLSWFRVTANTPVSTSQQMIFNWQSATGRLYDVDYRTNMSLGGWISCGTNIPAAPQVNAFTGTMSQVDRLFYRVRVRQ